MQINLDSTLDMMLRRFRSPVERYGCTGLLASTRRIFAFLHPCFRVRRKADAVSPGLLQAVLSAGALESRQDSCYVKQLVSFGATTATA